MEITIQKEKREILVQTVSLGHNELEPNNLYLFRCPSCSTGVSQIKGVVSKISPGIEPNNDVAVLHQCPKCKKIYVFQTLEYLDKKNTKVTLVSFPGTVGIFYCWLCRNPLLQFIDDKVVAFPDFTLKKIPFTMDCVNPKCPAKYHVTDLIKM